MSLEELHSMVLVPLRLRGVRVNLRLAINSVHVEVLMQSCKI